MVCDDDDMKAGVETRVPPRIPVSGWLPVPLVLVEDQYPKLSYSTEVSRVFVDIEAVFLREEHCRC